MAEFLKKEFNVVKPEDEIIFDITYKGYTTHVHYSYENHLWYGKIEGISDLVTYEAEDREGFEKAFHEAVEDYLAFCKDLDDSRTARLHSHETKR